MFCTHYLSARVVIDTFSDQAKLRISVQDVKNVQVAKAALEGVVGIPA